VFPVIAGTSASAAFSHIFSGGYSAGYYSYKWAEVLDADAFEYFREKGIFNREVAMKFRREILSKGATEHPMELYKRFRGREPKQDALLKRDGLI
jgi:peptidyl-dipeptidase Dcp